MMEPEKRLNYEKKRKLPLKASYLIEAEKLELTRPTLASKVYGDKMNKLLPCKPVDFFTQPVNGLGNSTDPDLPHIDVSTSSDISLRSEKSNDQSNS